MVRKRKKKTFDLLFFTRDMGRTLNKLSLEGSVKEMACDNVDVRGSY